ncbi:MAG: hypothetical protein IJL79_04720 [Candidatus Methanomethylophilaceae archaeon]|nr:hypothetical protein [Candidatus Methanomethylophilaceae archaeon]
MATSFRVLFLETTAALITSAFGLVAALAWNDAIKKAIGMWLGTGDDELIGLLVYALIVTVIAVVATLLIAMALAKAKGLVGADDAE